MICREFIVQFLYSQQDNSIIDPLMKAQARNQTYLWKKIRKESKQQIKQASVLSEDSDNQKKTLNISKLLPQVENKKQDTKELDDFINQIQKSGIPVEYYQEAESEIEIETSSQIQHKKYPFKSKQNTQQIMAQSIIQKYDVDQELRNELLNMSDPLIQSNQIPPSVSVKINRELIKVKIILGQLKKLSSYLQDQKKKLRQNLQNIQIEIINKFVQKIEQQKRDSKNREFQRENLKNRVLMLENEIRSKQQKIQNINQEVQNLRTQNFELAFDLNQRIEQVDLLVEEKVNKLMQQRTKKEHGSTGKIPSVVQELNFSKIQQKSKGKKIVDYPIEQIERRYQNHFIERYKVLDSKSIFQNEVQSKPNMNRKLFKQYGQLKSKNSLQITNNNISKNEDEINKKIDQIRKKYRTSKPQTPTVVANVYKNSHELMQNKSQIFMLQSNNSTNINNFEFLNNYTSKNIMKKISSPKSQGVNLKGFNHSNDVLTKNPQKPYEFRDFKQQAKVNNGLQSYKLDRLGSRIDQLRNQIKKQIQASK